MVFLRSGWLEEVEALRRRVRTSAAVSGSGSGRPAMRAEQLLEQAASIVDRRRRTYGQPTELFEHVARRWSLVLGVKVTPAQAMLCLSTSRSPG